MRVPAAALVVLIALGISACGGSSNSGTSAQGSPATSSAASSTSPPATSTSTVTSTVSTTVAAGPPLCVAGDLVASFIGQNGAMGHGLLGFALRNTSGHTCHTYGYPGVLFLDKSGHPLRTVSTRTTRDFFGAAPKTELTVAAGSEVSFRLGVTHVATSRAQCTTAYALQVIPPDDTHTLLAKIPGGAYECGTATVTPLRSGTSAFG